MNGTAANESPSPLQGRRALVVGGSGGIGRAVAELLAERGAQVTATGTRKMMPGAVFGYVQCRIGGGVSSEQAVEFILSKVPAPEIVVCAWGPFFRAPLAETKPADWRNLVENNLIFPGILISAVLRGMIENGWGRILLFGGTGTAAIKGYRTTAAYSAAKTALGSLAKSAALEAGSRGVSCNVVCPGFVDTEYCGPADRAYNAAHSPGGKALTPGEVARFALGILEDGRLNGEVLPFERADL